MTASWDASDILNGLERAQKAFQQGARRGLGDWAELVLDEAVRIVPIEEGTLQNSGTVAQSLDGLEAAIGFGSGGAAAYAIVQHEHLEFRHNAGRRAKFLEIPLQASKASGMALVARAIQEEM